MWLNLGFIIGSYLLGSLPHLYLLGLLRGRHLSGGDLHMELWRRGGRLLGSIGFLLELAKVIIPIVTGRSRGLETSIIVLGGLAAVAGQMWPIFFHFDGEKGNSIGIAMAATMTPSPFFIAFIFMATGFLIRTIPRFVKEGQSVNEKLKLGRHPSLSFPLGMATGFAVLPLANWGLGGPVTITLGYTALFGLIMLRRATAGLSLDLKAGKKLTTVIINRLLYDRAEI